MDVAILGTRGIPASYSGFETAVEQITARLTARGHRVTVYCRPHVVSRDIREWKGARLVHLPTVRNKYLDTFVHTLLSSVHAGRRRPDVALFFIAGNSPLCLITRAAGIPTVINVDGLDSDRRKWNRFAKAYLRAAERMSPTMATRAMTDSHAVAAIYQRRYGREIGVVPYGAEVPEYTDGGVLDKLGLEPRRYVLFVGPPGAREQPAPAGRGLGADPVGQDARHEAGGGGRRALRLRVHHPRPPRRRPRVIFPGYVFGPGYWELQRNAYLFCAPTEVGGTHPVILESLAAGNCVLVNDYRPNAETVGDAGVYFSGEEGVPDLARKLERLLDEPETVQDFRAKALRPRRALLVGRGGLGLRAAAARRSAATRATARWSWTAWTSWSGRPPKLL